MSQWLKLCHAHTVAMSQGFTPIEVPWMVSEESIKATLPEGKTAVSTDTKQYLIGSGEQGFIEIWDKLSPDTKYVTTTPCFRIENGYEPGVVCPWFMKTELIWVSPTVNLEVGVRVLMKLARAIMRAWASKIDEVQTPEGWDLYIAGLEVGSYGFREVGDKRWVYGTGLAEPRFTTALRRIDRSVTVGQVKKGG